MTTKEQYRVIFDYKGYGSLFDSKGLFQDGLENVFVESYNQFIKAVNPNIEMWNAEAEAFGFDGSEDPNSMYMQFMQRKQNETLEDEMAKGVFVEIKRWEPQGAKYQWYIDEYGQFHMMLVGDMMGLGYIDICTHIEKI